MPNLWAKFPRIPAEDSGITDRRRKSYNQLIRHKIRMETNMTNNAIFATQLVSIVVFVFTVFGLYRLLVKQKDAAIDLLREKVDFLKLQLDTAKSSSPDILTERLSKRIDILKSELESISSDHDIRKDIINHKENEIKEYEDERNKLKEQIDQAKKLLENFTCPYCESPMVERAYHSELVEHDGREIDVDHECVVYECGLTIVDNYEKNPCKYIHMGV